MILFKNVFLTWEITNEKQTSRNYIYLATMAKRVVDDIDL